MDIQSAAKYMAHRYRIRRASWHPVDYLTNTGSWLTKHRHYVIHIWDHDLKEIVAHHREENTEMNALETEDLLADDWEVITTNIRKDFNKYGHVEYNDEPDWDNYVCSGWGDEEEK